MGTRSASGPGRYKTNEIPSGATGTFSMVLVPPDARTAAEATAADHLDWLARVMLTDGDRLGALLAALLLRHLIPQSDLRTPGKPAPEDLYMRLREDGRLDAAAGTAAADYIAAPIDKLLTKLQETCEGKRRQRDRIDLPHLAATGLAALPTEPSTADMQAGAMPWRRNRVRP